MKQYLDLLKTIMTAGVTKESGRAGMPNTRGVFGYQMRFDLSKGFPLLTTKKMPFKTIAHELIWFLRGDTNIKYLVDNNCHIWDGDAFRHYNNKGFQKSMPRTMEQFIDDVRQGVSIESDNDLYTFGDLGNVYGAQWRNWVSVAWDEKDRQVKDSVHNHTDQIKKVIDGIKKNPFGRRHIVTAWNPAEVDNMALPPCHLLFQFNCRPIPPSERAGLANLKIIVACDQQEFQESSFQEKQDMRDEGALKLDIPESVPKFYLDCALTQRSCDSFLGVPFNIASYALLTEIVAKMCNMVAGTFIWNGNDTHIYDNHVDAVREQLGREPMKLCTLKISDRVKSFEDIAELSIDDLSIENYVSHPPIKGELSVGV